MRPGDASTSSLMAGIADGGCQTTFMERGRQSAGAGVWYVVLTVIAIPILLSASGVLDLRIPWPWLDQDPDSVEEDAAEATDAVTDTAGKVLTPDSPVHVRWTGVADTVEVSWNEVDDPELHHYTVDMEALSPIENWYSVGYRIGEELRTTDVTNPIALLNEKLSESGSTERADNNRLFTIQGVVGA